MIKYLFLGILILLPLQFALNVGDSADLVTTRLLVPAVFSLWLLSGLARKKIWMANRAETWLTLLFLFLSALSLWMGLDPEKGVRKILYLFSIFPIYFVAADLARDEKFRIRIIKVIWVSGALAAAVGVGQFLLPFLIGLDKTLTVWRKLAPFFLGSSFGKLVTDNPSWLVNVSGETWMRAFGFFADPHMFSFFVSLCLFAALGYFAWEKDWKWKILAGVAAALMFFSIIFSFSRGAYLGVIAGGLFFLIVLLIKAGNAGKIAVIGAVLIFLAAVFFQGTIQSRLMSAFNFKEGSNAERAKNWRQAFDVARDYPLSGIGLGNYASYIDPASGERSSIYAHNTFLDISAETGVINGFVFLALILVSLWRNVYPHTNFWELFKEQKKENTSVTVAHSGKNDRIGVGVNLGVASGLVYFLIHGIFDTPIWSPQVMVILLVIISLGLPPGKPRTLNSEPEVAA